MTWACGARATAAGPPVTPQAGPASPRVATPSPPAEPVVPPSPLPTSRGETGVDECALIATPGEPIVTVALSEPVDPGNALHPSNDSERLLFKQLYETLVRVDCMGRIVAGLAGSWRLDADGRTWLLTLRDNARFSDGTAVTAADVAAGWTRDGSASDLRPHVSRLVQSIVPAGERVLAITLRTRADAPTALAHPDLAVGKPVSDSTWPLGTRAITVAPNGVASRSTSISEVTLIRENLPSLRFVVASGDPRDLLDRDVDLLLTRDVSTLEYAATLPQFQAVPLAWQRTELLLTPGRLRSASSLSDDARQMLAVDAVRGEARGARGPFWWETVAECDLASVPVRNASPPISRIVYDVGDRAARDLAERLVGLVRASGPAGMTLLDTLLPDRPRRTFQRAAGLTGASLARALRLGTDAGYIVAVDSRSLDPCRDLHALVDRAGWVDPQTIVPLVDTRLQAIVRRGRTGASTEWDGGLVMAPGEGRAGPR